MKVKKDGSALIHVRNHTQQPTISIGGKTPKADGNPKIPSAEELSEIAKRFGNGVSLVSAKQTENRNGWKGYELVFQVADINQLVLDESLLDPTRNEDAEEAGDAAEAVKKDDSKGKSFGSKFQFAMKDGTLEVFNESLNRLGKPQEEEEASLGAADPFADAPAAMSTNIGQAAVEQMMAKALVDMRIGVFVEAANEIESTNATFQNGNMITLMSINVGEMMNSPNAKQNLRALKSLESAANRRQRLEEIGGEIDGMNVDLHDPIIIKFN
ncbi:MAG: hypothetical protein AB8B91_23305 [Rubripirellula sp.]